MRDYTITEIKEKLQSALSVRRYAHTLQVQAVAELLAKQYGASVEKTVLAALLHDCAKDYPQDIMQRFCKEYGIYVDEHMKQSPQIIHAFLGAEVARREYGVTDEEILGAICYHTTGRMNMPLLEKIIYVADMIEPGRNFDGVQDIRAIACENLDAALYMALKRTKDYLQNKHKPVHPLTEKALQDPALLLAAKDFGYPKGFKING